MKESDLQTLLNNTLCNKLKVLIACEESQTVCKAFRTIGCEAYSCDVLPCTGGYPEWHIECDVLEILNQGWDLMIAHPPCTYLACSSVQWLSHPEDKNLPFEHRRPNPRYPERRMQMLQSIEFIKSLSSAPIPYIAIENPVGLLSRYWQKPTQIIQPYYFGDEATKTTCLWLKGLPKLEHTNLVGKGERTIYSSGKSHPKWYADAKGKKRTKCQAIRSKTFQGFANAMAVQWTSYILTQK